MFSQKFLLVASAVAGLAAFQAATPAAAVCPPDPDKFLQFVITLLLGVLIPGPDVWRRRLQDRQQSPPASS